MNYIKGISLKEFDEAYEKAQLNIKYSLFQLNINCLRAIRDNATGDRKIAYERMKQAMKENGDGYNALKTISMLEVYRFMHIEVAKIREERRNP